MQTKNTQVKNVCPATELLTLLSRRHMLLILYTLTSGAKGFNELHESLDINTATLTDRLRELEAQNLVEKQSCSHDSRCRTYALTEKGNTVSALIKQMPQD